MKRLLLIIALILLLPVLATGVLLNTTLPLQWAAGKLPDWTDGMVSVGSVSGTLAGVIVLHDIRIRAGGDVITIARLEADAEPSALLAGSVHLPRVRISETDYLQQAVAEDAPDQDDEAFDIQALLAALQLPVSLDFPRVTLSDFHVCRPAATGGQPRCETWLEEMQLGVHWSDTAIEVNGLDGRSAESSASGNIRLELDGANNVTASLAAASSLRQPALAATLELDGSLTELLFDLDVSHQGHEQALLSLAGKLLNLPDTARDQVSLDADISLGSMSLSTLNDWLTLELPAETWSMHGKLSGTLDDAMFEGNIDGSYAPLDSIAGAVVLRWHQQQLRIQATNLAVLPLSSAIRADATLAFGKGFTWQGNAEIRRIEWPGTEALDLRAVTVDARGDTKRLTAHAIATVLGENSKPLEVNGELDFDSLQFSADLAAPRIHASPPVTLGNVKLQLKGKPSDYRFESDGKAELRVGGRKLPEAQWKINGSGTLQSLAANLQQVNWLTGSLHGRVGIDWEKSVRIAGRLAGQGLDVAPLAQLARLDVDSRLSPAFNFNLQPGNNFLVAEISNFELGGNYNGHAVKGQGGIAWRKDRLEADGFQLEVGAARMLLDSGDMISPALLHVAVDVPEMATLLPGGGGRFTLDAKVDATFNSLAANGSFTAAELRWQEWQLDSANIELDLPLQTDTSSDSIMPGNASATLTGMQLAGTRIDSLTLKLQGDRVAHEFELGISAAGNTTRLQGSGQLDAMHSWQGQLSEWRIKRQTESGKVLPEWQLASAGRIRLAPDSVGIEKHCLESAAARACLGPLRYTADEVHANLEITQLPLASFEPLLPGGIRISGSLDGRLELHSDATGRRGQADFSMSEGSVSERRFAANGEPESDELLTSWDSGNFAAQLRNRLLTASANMDFLDTGSMNARSRIEFPSVWPQAGSAGEASLQGNVDIEVFDLSLLPAFFPQLREVHGELQAGLQASGTLNQPSLTGTLDFTNGTAELTPLGTTWQDIELHLQSTRNRLAGTGSVSSDGGRLDIEISGEARDELLAAKLAVRGENFLALRMPEAVVRLSPDLQMQLADRHFEASGTVQVPLARIRPRDLSSAVQPSNDQVIVNRQSGTERPFTYSAQVTTVLGEDVSFEGFGLDAQLQGRLTVTARSGTPATGWGEVGIRSGEYRIYGQELDIVRGRLIYTGQPLTDPGLDVRALRRIRNDLTVGLNLRGTATQPLLDVFSEPPMSQDETLAYLISGGSIGDATSEEKRQVDSASLALGLGAGKILGQVGERVGVDEIRFSQVGNREEASFILGKYLSPDLYVGYGIGLFDAVNSFRINYQLSSKWTLEAISGIKSSADLIYTIER